MFVSVVLLLVTATPSLPRLVVTPFRSVQTSAELTTFGAEHLAQTLHERGFEVITPQDVSTLLGFERQKTLLGCSGEEQASCLAELSGALGAGAVVTGSIAKLGGAFTIEVKVLSPRDGKTLASARSDAPDERRYLAAVDAVADMLDAQLRNEGRAPTPSGPGARLWVPVGIGVALVGGGGALLGVAFSQVNQLTSAPSASDPKFYDYGSAQQQFNDATTLRTTGITLMGLGAAVAVMGVVLTVTAPVAVVPVVSNGQAGVAVAGVLP
jgi:TolB-like protein